MAVKMPKGFHAVTPFLMVRDAEELTKFMQNGLGATDCTIYRDASGALMHAEIKLGDSMVMIGEASPRDQPTPGALYFYVDDADALFKRAVKAGGTPVMEPADQFWGDHVG